MIIKFFCNIFRKKVPISMMYHTISNNNTSIAIDKDSFENQLLYVGKNGFDVIREPLLDSQMTNNSVHITFDDGYEDNFTTVFPLLLKYKMPATIFITTNFLGKKFAYDISLMSKEQLLFMAKSNLVTIGAHTLNHPKLDLLSYKEQEKEILGSKYFLEDLLNRNINIFASPYGRYNNITLKILEENNFKLSFTTKPGIMSIKSRFEINRIPVMKSNIGLFRYINTDGYLKYKKAISILKRFK